MAKKAVLKSLAVLAFVLWVSSSVAFPAFAADPNNVPPAADANGCQSQQIGSTGKWATPSNCLFLEEPLDDKNLYVVTCTPVSTVPGKLADEASPVLCKTLPYNGGVIDTKTSRGPIQAILTSQASKPEQGSFGLLYNYMHLLYNYLSGIIIGISVLFVVVGGIQIATSGGSEEGYGKGIGRIKHAVMGLVLWFTASLILYTINPTFFTLG